MAGIGDRRAEVAALEGRKLNEVMARMLGWKTKPSDWPASPYWYSPGGTVAVTAPDFVGDDRLTWAAVEGCRFDRVSLRMRDGVWTFLGFADGKGTPLDGHSDTDRNTAILRFCLLYAEENRAEEGGDGNG